MDTRLEKLEEQHLLGAVHSLTVRAKLTNRIRMLEREVRKADREIKLKLKVPTLWDVVTKLLDIIDEVDTIDRGAATKANASSSAEIAEVMSIQKPMYHLQRKLQR